MDGERMDLFTKMLIRWLTKPGNYNVLPQTVDTYAIF